MFAYLECISYVNVSRYSTMERTDQLLAEVRLLVKDSAHPGTEYTRKHGLVFDEENHRWEKPDKIAIESKLPAHLSEESVDGLHSFSASGFSAEGYFETQNNSTLFVNEDAPTYKERDKNKNLMLYTHGDGKDNPYSFPINSWLLTGNVDTPDGKIEGKHKLVTRKVSEMMKPMRESQITYRGMTRMLENTKGAEAQIGDEITVRAFMSTGKNIAYASEFMYLDDHVDMPVRTMIEVHSTPDARGITLSSEGETLYDRDQVLVIEAVYDAVSYPSWRNNAQYDKYVVATLKPSKRRKIAPVERTPEERIQRTRKQVSQTLAGTLRRLDSLSDLSPLFNEIYRELSQPRHDFNGGGDVNALYKAFEDAVLKWDKAGYGEAKNYDVEHVVSALRTSLIAINRLREIENQGNIHKHVMKAPEGTEWTREHGLVFDEDDRRWEKPDGEETSNSLSQTTREWPEYITNIDVGVAYPKKTHNRYEGNTITPYEKHVPGHNYEPWEVKIGTYISIPYTSNRKDRGQSGKVIERTPKGKVLVQFAKGKPKWVAANGYIPLNVPGYLSVLQENSDVVSPNTKNQLKKLLGAHRGWDYEAEFVHKHHSQYQDRDTMGIAEQWGSWNSVYLSRKLRDGKDLDDTEKEILKAVQDASKPMNDTMTLWRGSYDPRKFKVGQKWLMSTPISTSTAPNIAIRYMTADWGKEKEDHKQTLFQIRSEKGTRGMIYYDMLREVALPMGTEVEVLKVEEMYPWGETNYGGKKVPPTQVVILQARSV